MAVHTTSLTPIDADAVAARSGGRHLLAQALQASRRDTLATFAACAAALPDLAALPRSCVQLVQGPQYATGVGLLRYGAQQLADRAQHHAPAQPGRVQHVQDDAELGAPAGKSGFWSWFRAAF